MSIVETVEVMNNFDKNLMFPVYGNVKLREENSRHVEHLETNLDWMHNLHSTKDRIEDTFENYEKIKTEDVLCHPFSFQPVVPNTTSELANWLAKIYYIFVNHFMKSLFH